MDFRDPAQALKAAAAEEEAVDSKAEHPRSPRYPVARSKRYSATQTSACAGAKEGCLCHFSVAGVAEGGGAGVVGEVVVGVVEVAAGKVAVAGVGRRRSPVLALAEAVDVELPSLRQAADKLKGRSVDYRPDFRTRSSRVPVGYRC